MNEDRRPRLSVVLFFLAALVLFIGALSTLPGCPDIDEVMTHYLEASDK